MSFIRARQAVYACFFVSGAAGLVYEVVWARQLTLFLGVTSIAHTTVITAFLGGLAIGALLIGRFADRRSDCLRIYSLLEGAIAAYAIATPLIFSGLQSLYAVTVHRFGLVGAQASGLGFVMALAALLVPTILMGGTLPLLVRAIAGGPRRVSSEISHLYGWNTLGATFGAFAAGYLLLPGVGVRASIAFAAAANLLVALVAWQLGSRPVAVATAPAVDDAGATLRVPTSPSATLRPAQARLLLAGFALSGFASLVYQLAWIRSLTLTVGSSVYAFSATLTTFLAGLGLGSLLYHRFGTRHRRLSSVKSRMRLAGVLELLTGGTAILGLWILGRLPELFLAGAGAGLLESFAGFQFLTFSLCAAIMLPPTLLLGALFPLITGIWVRDTRSVGGSVGSAYAVNTLGTIAGSLLGGLFLLPLFGVQRSLVAASALHVVVGIGFWIVGSEGRAARRRFLPVSMAAAGIALLAVAAPPWDRSLMSSGVFFLPHRTLAAMRGRDLRSVANEREMLYYAEGRDGVVAVIRNGKNRTLLINGKPDASSVSDLPTQVLLGQVPMFLHPDPRQVLVIGLGSGVTAGSVASHSSVEAIEVVEISPQVVEASDFFAFENGDVLRDDRTRVVLADARNYLLASSRKWDVIISEPSNPWVTGVANLFTREAFELAQSRLAPHGLLAQWFHIYNMQAEDLRSVFRTFSDVFPVVSVWSPSFGDLILIGSDDPHHFDYGRLQVLFDKPAIAGDLSRVDIWSADDLVTTFLMGLEELREYSEGARLNTDDRPLIEFNAPRRVYSETSVSNMLELTGSGLLVAAPVVGMFTSDEEGFNAPSFGLTILAPRGLRDADGEAQWLVGKTVVRSNDPSVQLIASTSRKVLSWTEEGQEYRLQDAGLDSEVTPQRLLQGLRSVLGAEQPVGDVIELPCGERGLWGTVRDRDRGDVAMAVVWNGLEESPRNIFVGFRRFDELAVEDLEAAAQQLAARFRSCSTAPG